jgi:hypothetical protein
LTLRPFSTTYTQRAKEKSQKCMMLQQIEPRGFDRNNRKKKTRLYLSLINIQEKEKLERRERETTIIILRLTADGSL